MPAPSRAPRKPPKAETSKTIGPSGVSATSTVVLRVLSVFHFSVKVRPRSLTWWVGRELAGRCDGQRCEVRGVEGWVMVVVRVMTKLGRVMMMVVLVMMMVARVMMMVARVMMMVVWVIMMVARVMPMVVMVRQWL